MPDGIVANPSTVDILWPRKGFFAQTSFNINQFFALFSFAPDRLFAVRRESSRTE
jgi:hypothetical protein